MVYISVLDSDQEHRRDSTVKQKPDNLRRYLAQLPLLCELHLTPETFSRILHHLAEEGLITVSRKKIDIHDVEQLRQFSCELIR
jgi:CRP-like cAMP-binding protein